MDLDQYEYGLVECDQDFRWCHQYAKRIITGEIVAGRYIKKACERHINDLARTDIYFDEKAAASVVLFFRFIPITDGKKVGESTVLLPWQIFFVCCIVGWKYTDSDLRKYKYAYCQVGRKNGKTVLSAGLSLYFMLKSGYFRPRVYSIATKRDQAKLLWSSAKVMIKLSPMLRKTFKTMSKEILIPSMEGEFTYLSSDYSSLDGLMPLLITLDECHAMKQRGLYSVSVSAFGAQPEGLLLTITTAGFVLNSICVELNNNGKRVLDGEIEQDSYLYMIYEIDQEDLPIWDDPKVWIKANPGLGYQPLMRYMEERAVEARLSSEEKANFMTKHLNIFVAGFDKWIAYDELIQCKFNKTMRDYEGRECWIGLDRSRVHDLTSFCLLFPNDQGGADCFYKNLLPEKTMLDSQDSIKEVYRKAQLDGSLQLLDTSTVRDEPIKEFIEWACSNYDVQMVGYDPWHMKEIAEDMAEQGFPMVSVSQGTGNMSEPAKKFEGLIKEQTFHYNDVLLEYAATNAILKITDANNVKVVRNNPKIDKIDPVIATIIALSCATLQSNDKNPYEQRGLIWI